VLLALIENSLKMRSNTLTFQTFVTVFSTAVLLLFSFQYQDRNDLAVYLASISESGYYGGDLVFEFIQLALFAIFGSDFVLTGLQTIVVIIAYFIYFKNRSRKGYLVFFLVFTSPVLILGLFNSIRQSLAQLIVLWAFDSRKPLSLKVVLSFLCAILIHQSSIILVALLLVRRFFNRSNLKFGRNINDMFIMSVGIVLVLCFIVFSPSIWDRYLVYLTNSVVFDIGRVGIIKFIPWLILWVLLIYFNNVNGKLKNRIPLIGLIYVGLLFGDAMIRGFDEFHSRMLLFNNSLVLALSLELVGSIRKFSPSILLILVINVFNPSSLGVIL